MPGDTLHPTPANAPPADAAIITTDSEPQGLSAEALDQWRAARDMLLGAHVTLALGTNEDQGPELFGGILDAAFDRDGNLLVLDAISYEVRTFDRDGRHRGSFGQQGEGPMDFDGTLQSLEVLEDGRLVVGIRGIGMKVFAPVAGAYEYLDLVPVLSVDMCGTAAARLFVTGYSYANERVLHEVDLAGDSVTQGFGHGYLDEDEFIRGQLSDGTIACVDDPLRILFAFKEHPILRAHRPGEDDPVWTAALAVRG